MSIDLVGPAIQYAKVEASKRGFKNRLLFNEGDVSQISYRDEFAHIYLSTCVMMGYDFWRRDK